MRHAIHRVPPAALLASIGLMLFSLPLSLAAAPAPVAEMEYWKKPKWWDAADEGNRFWEAGDRTGAVKKWEEAVEQGFREGPAFYHLGMFYRDQEDYEKAAEYLRQAIPFLQANGASAETLGLAHEALAATFLKLRDYGEAYVNYQKALKRRPDSPAAHLGMGTLYLAMGRFSGAEMEAREVLAAEPENAKALWLIAKTAERRGDFTLAAAGYREVLAVDPGWWETRQALGIILYARLGKTDEARRELETVIAQSPTAAVSRAALSEIWLGREDFDRAGDEAAAALAVDPNNYQALVVLGQIFLQGGEPARAEELFRRAARISGGGPLAHYGLGLLAARDKDWTKAEEYFRDALDAYPVFVEARYNLAVALEAEGKREEALAALEAVVSDRPDFFLAHAARGRILYLSGRYDPAIPALRNALALDPRAWEPPYFLGKCYYEKREDQAALAYLKEAAELAPDNPAVLSDLGLAYDRAGQSGPARETLQRALQANPHYVRAALNLAVLEARGKGPGGEAAAYRRALIVKPGDVAWGFDGEESDFVEKLVSGLDGYLAVGIDYLSLYELIKNAYRDQPILKDLVPILEKKAAQQPLKPQFQHLLGLAYQDAGKTKEAEERFKKALKLDSDFAAAHLSLGYLYAQQGKTAPARDHLEAFVALSPDSSLTPAVREYLEGLAPVEKVPAR